MDKLADKNVWARTVNSNIVLKRTFSISSYYDPAITNCGFPSNFLTREKSSFKDVKNQLKISFF